MLLSLALATLLAPAQPLAQSRAIADYVQPGFRDISFSATIVQKRLSELRKIGPEFSQTYLFDTISVRAKEPFKLRLDAAADDTRATYLINGARQSFSVPRLGLKQSNDLSKYPGRRQTLLDFALPTPSLFADFYDAAFVRFDRESGNPVFDLRFPTSTKDTSRNRVWIDRATRTIVRREWYGQSDALKAVFLYAKPIKKDGIWFNTELTVKNAEDKVGGVTRYSNVRVNTGLDDAVFRL